LTQNDTWQPTALVGINSVVSGEEKHIPRIQSLSKTATTDYHIVHATRTIVLRDKKKKGRPNNKHRNSKTSGTLSTTRRTKQVELNTQPTTLWTTTPQASLSGHENSTSGCIPAPVAVLLLRTPTFLLSPYHVKDLKEYIDILFRASQAEHPHRAQPAHRRDSRAHPEAVRRRGTRTQVQDPGLCTAKSHESDDQKKELKKPGRSTDLSVAPDVLGRTAQR
jgi:hypothetical protein